MINPLDVAKEIKAMAGTLGMEDQSLGPEGRLDVLEIATELWEKVYAINHCDACGNPYPDPTEEADPADAWKHGDPEHDPENN